MFGSRDRSKVLEHWFGRWPPLGPVQRVAAVVAQVGTKEDRVGRQLQVEAGRGVEGADGGALARHDRSLGLPVAGDIVGEFSGGRSARVWASWKTYKRGSRRASDSSTEFSRKYTVPEAFGSIRMKILSVQIGPGWMSRWARSGCADGELRLSIGQATSARPTGPRPRLGRTVGGLPCDPVIVTPAPFSRVLLARRGRAGRRRTTSNRPSTSRVRRRPRRVIHPRRPTRSNPRHRFLWPKPSPTGCGTTRGSNRHQLRSRRLEKAWKSRSHPSCPS